MIKVLPSQIEMWTGGTDSNSYQLGVIVDQGWRWDNEDPFNFVSWADGI